MITSPPPPNSFQLILYPVAFSIAPAAWATRNGHDHVLMGERHFLGLGQRRRDGRRMSPRQAWRAIQAGLPREAIISSDIGNNCAIGNAYPSFEDGRKYLAPGLFGPCGYGFPAIVGAKIGNPDTPCVGFAGDGAFGISMNEMSSIGRDGWPGVTMVMFRNYQWGAEKRNSILWYDDNFVGTELNPNLSYAKVAEACGFEGVVGDDAGRADRGAAQVMRRPEARRHHLHRSGAQPGARRAVPPRRDEEAGRRRRNPPRGHAGANESLSGALSPSSTFGRRASRVELPRRRGP